MTRRFVVDGTVPEDGAYQGDGQQAPFVVFDIDGQDNVAGPYRFRWQARLSCWLISQFWF